MAPAGRALDVCDRRQGQGQRQPGWTTFAPRIERSAAAIAGAMRSRLCWRLLLASVAAMGLAGLVVAGAGAHADLIGSEPAAGSTVSGSPSRIRLSFSEPLVSGSSMQLFTGQFEQVAGLSVSAAGSELQAVVGTPLRPATYTVQWMA